MIAKDYSEIGAVLRLAREELNLTIPDVSRYLHIRAHYLQALEQGELEKLPSVAYAKGYLQSYANFLRLDKDEIIRRFEQVKNKLPERAFFFPQVFSTEKKPTNTIVWSGIGVAFALYILWVVLFKPASIPELAVEPPPEIKASVPVGFNVVCAVPQTELYPACYRLDFSAPDEENSENKNAENLSLPLIGNIKTIMELAK